MYCLSTLFIKATKAISTINDFTRNLKCHIQYQVKQVIDYREYIFAFNSYLIQLSIYEKLYYLILFFTNKTNAPPNGKLV